MAMSAPTRTIHADLPPLHLDHGDVIRVGNTRISLDLIVEQYENGMTPEALVRAYDSLTLADVHAAIAYYLRHRSEVQSYLEQRKQAAADLRAAVEAERTPVSRGELIARRQTEETSNVATGQ